MNPFVEVRGHLIRMMVDIDRYGVCVSERRRDRVIDERDAADGTQRFGSDPRQRTQTRAFAGRQDQRG